MPKKYIVLDRDGVINVDLFDYVLKNEDWLTRGVKNVNALPRPVPYELNLQESKWFIEFCERYQFPLVETSSIIVKLC